MYIKIIYFSAHCQKIGKSKILEVVESKKKQKKNKPKGQQRMTKINKGKLNLHNNRHLFVLLLHTYPTRLYKYLHLSICKILDMISGT